MISPINAFGVAFTKIRQKKIRVIAMVLICGILFGGLFGVSFIINGLSTSVLKFSDSTYSSRLIISADNQYVGTSDDSSAHDELQELLNGECRRLLDIRKQKARELGIEYSDTQQQLDSGMTLSGTDGENSTAKCDSSTKIGAVANANIYNNNYRQKRDGIYQQTNDIIRSFKPKNIFETKTKYFGFSDNLTLRDSDGKFPIRDKLSATDSKPAVELDRPMSWIGVKFTPGELVKNYLFPNNADWRSTDNAIPVIIDTDIAMAITGTKVAGNASLDELVKITKATTQIAKGLTFEQCYRNDIAMKQIESYFQRQRAKNNLKPNQKLPPAIEYNLPNQQDCQNPVIASDTRSAEQIKADDDIKKLDQATGYYREPQSRLIKYKVVGVYPTAFSNAPPTHNGAQIINYLASSTLSPDFMTRYMIVDELYQQLPESTKIDSILTDNNVFKALHSDVNSRYIQFSDSKSLADYVKNNTCNRTDNPCVTDGTKTLSSPIPHASLIGKVLNDQVAMYLPQTILIIGSLTCLLAMLIIGTVVAGSKSDIAILRATGYRRSDITIIYLGYALILATLTLIVGVAIGYGLTYLADYFLAGTLTTTLQLAADIDSSHSASLIGSWTELSSNIALLCIGSIVVAAIIPIIFANHRNLIDGLRQIK